MIPRCVHLVKIMASYMRPLSLAARTEGGEAFWKALAHNPEAFRAAVKAVRDCEDELGAKGLSTTSALRLMGSENILTIMSARRCFGRGLRFRPQVVVSTGFTEEQLKGRGGLYVKGLFLMQFTVQLSLLELFGKHPDFFGLNTKKWLGDPQQTFAHTRPEFGWRLIHKQVVNKGCDWDTLVDTKHAHEVVPSSSMLVQAHLLHHHVGGVGLFYGAAYTSDRFFDDQAILGEGPRVIVVFHDDGVEIKPENEVATADIGLVPFVEPSS